MKKGFTLIEVLITTLLLGIFMIAVFPVINRVSNIFYIINEQQLNNFEKVNFYHQINCITSCSNEIYYDFNEKKVLYIKNNTIEIKEDITLINNISFEIFCVDVLIKDNMILLLMKINNENEIIILEGNVYEVCRG